MIELRTVSGEHDLDEVVADCLLVHFGYLDKDRLVFVMEGQKSRVVLHIVRQHKRVLVKLVVRGAVGGSVDSGDLGNGIYLSTGPGARNVRGASGVNCHVHLEQMSKKLWTLILSRGKDSVILNVFRKGKRLLVTVFEDDREGS